MTVNTLEIKNLHFSYKYNAFKHAMTFRDLFVQSLNSPINYFKSAEVVPILKNLSLTLQKGDRVAITGVNGAGKTTLCRLILGLIKPQLGTIKANGEKRGVFYSQAGMYPELTGRENATILTELLYSNLSKVMKAKMIEEALEFSELKNFLDMPYQLYSKGMQNRLYLSLVSALPTDLLIIDEVFDGADITFQKKVTERFQKMISLCHSTVFVSHSEDNIKKICNKKYLLQNGYLTQYEN